MDDIYGGRRPQLEVVLARLVDCVDALRESMVTTDGLDPIEHVLSRVKSDKSMREKCRRKGLPETPESALTKLYDAVGVRVVCPFLSDVYAVDTWAALEHQLQYKKHRMGNQRLIVQELKRCADELASTDVSMQTIRNMILAEEQ